MNIYIYIYVHICPRYTQAQWFVVDTQMVMSSVVVG